MSDFRMVSPLLDGYTVDKAVMTQRDRTWYSVKHIESGEHFVLKHLSVPASDAQVRALILSGIYENEQDVLAYYTGMVNDIQRELDLGKKLAETGCFAGPVDYQVVQKTDGIGYDIYILQALQVPLNELINRNGMTHLRAVNLGIDLCDAIIACREAGYLFANLKPDNIFLVPSGKFMLGDLGLIPLRDLEYASISEDYIGPFSPPELFDLTGIPNVTLDLYSLGMVLYRIYNGNHGPFEDENTDTAMADKLRLSGKPLPTPIYADYELSGIITKACSYQVPLRFNSPEQLKEALLHYLQRNQIPDSLIVPPLVVDPEPIAVEEESVAAEEPLRMVDAAELDDAFKESFAPSSENAGDEVIDTPAPEATVAPVATAEPEEAPKDDEIPVLILPTAKESPVAEKAEAVSEVAPETEKAEPAPEVAPEAEKAEPAPEVAPEAEKAEPAPEVAPEAKKAEPAKDNLLSANAVTGPKMPTGNLKMNKKGKRSRHRKNLVVEVPCDSEESEAAAEVAPIPTTIVVDAPADSKDSDKAVPSQEAPKTANSAGFTMKSEPFSSEDVDIDSLIASVNEVVGIADPSDSDDSATAEGFNLTMHVAPAESGYSDSLHEDVHEERTEEQEEKKKAKWLPISLVACLSVAIVSALIFLLCNYYVNITELKLVNHTTNAITVDLITPDAQDCFIVTCTDSYGHSYTRSTEGSQHTFVDLNENTAYTIKVVASKHHRLRSGKSYSITVKTPGSTKISDFTARRGAQEGDVVLNFNSEGPSPEEWQFTYTDSNGVLSGPFPFTDHTALVPGLTEGVTYTFAIEVPGDLFLSGETSVEYTLYPIVTATDLRITEVNGTTVSLVWVAGENYPAEWSVTCEGGDYSQTVTTAGQKVTFENLPDLARDYVFSVSALGMDEPATLTLPANPVVLEDFVAEYQEDGSVKVSWSTPAGVPGSGWHLSYNTVGNMQIPDLVRDITTDSVILTDLIPNAEYKFTLQSTIGDALIDIYGETSITFVTREAEIFDGYDIDPAPVFTRESGNLSLWLCPEEEDWIYRDLETTRNEFTKAEKIAVCLQVQSVSASEDNVTLLYVIRDEEGRVVADESQEFTWDSLWFDRRHANEVPLPRANGSQESTPGKYTLEIYINGKLLVQRGFTIV